MLPGYVIVTIFYYNPEYWNFSRLCSLYATPAQRKEYLHWKLKDLLNLTLVKNSSNSINTLDDLNNHHIHQDVLQNIDQFNQLNVFYKQSIRFQNVEFLGSINLFYSRANHCHFLCFERLVDFKSFFKTSFNVFVLAKAQEHHLSFLTKKNLQDDFPIISFFNFSNSNLISFQTFGNTVWIK